MLFLRRSGEEEEEEEEEEEKGSIEGLEVGSTRCWRGVAWQ